MARKPKNANIDIRQTARVFDEQAFVDGVFNDDYILVVGSGVILDRKQFPNSKGDINQYIIDEINSDRREVQTDFIDHKSFTDVYSSLGAVIAFFEQFALRVPTVNNPQKTIPIMSQIKTENTSPKTENKYDVFISYSRVDKEKTNVICQYLDKYGFSYWIDREGVHHGEIFKEEIIDAIESATILLFISSMNSNKSPNTVKEVSIAEKYNKVVIPIRIDDSSYNRSLEYNLCNKDWMDFQEGVDYDTSAQKLYENLRFYLDREERNL